jgi:hypothetical protein
MRKKAVLYPAMDYTNFYSDMPISCVITDDGNLVLNHHYNAFRFIKGDPGDVPSMIRALTLYHDARLDFLADSSAGRELIARGLVPGVTLADLDLEEAAAD